MNFIFAVAKALVAAFVSIGLVFGIGHAGKLPEAAIATSTMETPTQDDDSGSIPPSTFADKNAAKPAAVNTGASLNLAALPLGDGKYVTDKPKKGYVFLCNVNHEGKGAMADGSWIHGGTWDSTKKIAVRGSVSWPSAYAKVTVKNGIRTISANDLPTVHTTGIFPIQSSDPAYLIDRNPNAVAAQEFSISLPANPEFAEAPGCIFGQVGVMSDGVFIYDAFDAEYRDAPAHELQDTCDGHPNENGYHYHSLSGCIPKPLATNVIGWAFDGFPITGPTLSNGKELTSADLDECHGMTSEIIIDGKSTTSYHYVMTADFPYSLACFKGLSYEPRPSGPEKSSGNQTGAPTPSGTAQNPPAEAVSACSGKIQGAPCNIQTPNGNKTGTCLYPPGSNVFACIPGQ